MGSYMNINQKRSLLHRGYTDKGDISDTEWLPPSQFQIGFDTQNISQNTLALRNILPISDGTVNNNGAFTLTGLSGGSNTTNNTVIFKEGAGVTDNTAQNLIPNTSNTNKLWEISNLATNGTNVDVTKFCGLNIYLKSTVLEKIEHITIILGTSSTNAYQKKFLVEELNHGWNWLYLDVVQNLETVPSPAFTPFANANYFMIFIKTNNASDIWDTGAVVYDLLRSWTLADTFKDIVVGYPLVDLDNLEVQMRYYLNATEMNGFVFDSLASWNKDTVIKLMSASKFVKDSKSSTDEFSFVDVDKIR